jgi:hypothetical protein
VDAIPAVIADALAVQLSATVADATAVLIMVVLVA